MPRRRGPARWFASGIGAGWRVFVEVLNQLSELNQVVSCDWRLAFGIRQRSNSAGRGAQRGQLGTGGGRREAQNSWPSGRADADVINTPLQQIGRASCRERV